MPSRRKDLERRAGYLAFVMAEKAFLKKDVASAERTGARMGALAYRLSKKHRNRALSNLALAYPSMSEDERIELAQRCFRHFGRITADFLRSPVRTSQEVLDSSERIGFDNIDEALKHGKGAILVSGHIGNWERATHCVVASGYKLTVVVRDANDSDLNRHVLRIRETHGVEVLSRGNAARGILTKLKQNELVAILPDQNSGDIYVPFFGKPCGTVTGPGAIHARTGCPVLPVYSAWIAPGRYRMSALPPLSPVEGFEPVEGMTRAINDSLEAAIRETPEQWLWFHDRWKSARKAGLL